MRAKLIDTAPAGLSYQLDFVTKDEESALIDFLEDIAYEEVRFHGQVAKRSVRHYGYGYDYDARQAEPGDPIPESLEWLRLRCAEFTEVEPERVVECLVSRYPPGAGIGWHRDAPMFGSRVVGVSLGTACTMRFRRDTKTGREEYRAELLPRSAYVIGGSARWQWQHSIPAVDELRHSVTFRTLKS